MPCARSSAAVTLSRIVKSPVAGPTTRYFEHINRFSASFAFATDVAMLSLGGYLKKKENLSARLGDVLSAMYLASMVLKHFENQGRPEADLPLVEYACRSLLYQAQEQLHSFLRNFPVRWLAVHDAPVHLPARAHLLRALGPPEPEDRRTRDESGRGARAALPLRLPDARADESPRPRAAGDGTRDRGRADREEASASRASRPGKVTALDLPGQIREALAAGVITEAEAAQLREYDRKVMDIINVDDFEPRELVAGRSYEIQLDGGSFQVA